MKNENDFLIERLKKSEYDDNKINLIIEGLKASKLTTLRVNRLKTNISKVLDTFKSLGISYKTYNDIKDAVVLNKYPVKNGCDFDTGISIENLSMYKDGEIYLQSLSSMLPAIIISPNEKENILDMCAAPGGKTTMIQSLCNNKTNLTAIELHKDRYEKLSYNCNKQGANALIMNRNALDLDDMLKFDKILLDAPCSGSGTLDISTDKYKKSFTNELINKCVLTQKKLIKKAYKLLKKGGVLIYSTCSLLKEENEEIVDYGIKNGFEIDFCRLNLANTKISAGSSADNVYIKIFPDEVWEGFFIAKLIKP